MADPTELNERVSDPHTNLQPSVLNTNAPDDIEKYPGTVPRILSVSDNIVVVANINGIAEKVSKAQFASAWSPNNPGNPSVSGVNEAYIRAWREITGIPQSLEITVIDERDRVGWAASATRTGEVYMTNTKTMVDNVLKTLGDSSSISRLNILDHGNEFTVEIGDDILSKKTVSNYVPILSRLRGHFTRNAIVHIQHCDAGQNKDLVCAIAAAFGVPVYAGTGAHNPVLRFNFGNYVKCSPSGKFETHVSRP